MRVVFMGSPDFAVPTLTALLAEGHEVVGVVSQPDKPRARGGVMLPTAVKKYALAAGLAVETPQTLKDAAFLTTLTAWNPDVIVVVAFGKILPRAVLDLPRYGCINVHGSLLPAYRGAAPMQRAIMDGCAETGITIMYMDVGLDTGDMLSVVKTPIFANDNFETIHDRLAALGANALVEVLSGIENGTVVRTPQPEVGATYAEKISKAECLLDFTKPADVLHNIVRGLSPIPLSYAYLDGKLLKLKQTRPCPDYDTAGAMPGTVVALTGDAFLVACGKGALEVLAVLPEGKRAMSASDFIRGRQIAVGDRLTCEP